MRKRRWREARETGKSSRNEKRGERERRRGECRDAASQTVGIFITHYGYY